MNEVVRRRVISVKEKPKDIINTYTYKFNLTAGSIVNLPQQWQIFTAGRDYTFTWSINSALSYVRLELIRSGTTTEEFTTGNRWNQNTGSWTLAPITKTCDRLRGLVSDLESNATLTITITETIHPS